MRTKTKFKVSVPVSELQHLVNKSKLRFHFVMRSQHDETTYQISLKKPTNQNNTKIYIQSDTKSVYSFVLINV